MKAEAKKQLLNYFTNQLTNTSPTQDEIIKGNYNVSRSTWTSFLPSPYNNFRFEGMVEGNELTSGLSVLYGGYLDTNNNVKGIIILVDQEFQPVKTFYKYSSGTDLRYIQYMKQAEDGSFYFIDDTCYTYGQAQIGATSEKRFVIINNITVPVQEEYRLNLRTTYIFPNEYKNFYCKNMYKDPNSAHYIFFGSGATNDNGTWDWDALHIYGLEVNVGMPNVWTKYVEQTYGIFGSAIAQFNDDSQVQFRCIWSPNRLSSRTISCYSKTYTGNPSTSDIKTFDFKPYIDDYHFKKQSVFIDYNNVYFVQNNQRWGAVGTPNAKYIGLYKYNFSNNTSSTIYEKSLGNYDFTMQELIFIDRNLTDLYIEFIDNIDTATNKGNYYIQRWNGVWNPINIGNNKNCQWEYRTLYVKNNFNYLQIYSYAVNPRSATWYFNLVKEDYNSLNYNGEDYRSVDMFVPKKVNIYSYYPGTENTRFIFGRNLYNITMQDNMTMSSVEIPNNYLNNYTIEENNLISQTNYALNNNKTSWTKNFYEVVDLNFLNTINIIDEDTDARYKTGATKLNQAITNGGNTNYSNTPCIKYRINYVDETTSINTLNWQEFYKDNKQTYFVINVDKAIKNIDIISNDETTIYLTINGNFEIGETYTIWQKVRIGNKPNISGLQYNGIDVLYNNEEVQVYIQ